ncbi:GNAT family N-acetyltransferase [Amycolatopsis sp. NBC_00355]|uniref:GNAT family N-acetyltransferase n=1 Tax=Amycolatopsis sp. NBC_00355 TaxID=2975957 RepID=UPI002E25A058
MIHFRDLAATDADIAALTAFYQDHYADEFPDPDERESLANMIEYLRLREQGWYGRNNYHIILASMNGVTVGCSVIDYFAGTNVGMIEFLMVVPAVRNTGVGRAILAETERVLNSDATAETGTPLAHLFAEINDPFVPTGTPDNLDPADRAVIWDRWGFHGLDVPYAQPALSETQEPVTNLLLICKTFGRPCTPQTVRSAVADYLRWAMRVEDPERCPEFQALAAHLATLASVGTFSLSRYVGRPIPHARPLTAPTDPDWAATMELYRTTFGITEYGIPESEFIREYPVPLHFWTLRRTPASAVAGLVTFFTLTTAGFGGYGLFTGDLRGVGALRPMIAQVELRMLADRPSTRGWYIEVTPKTDQAPLRAVGFIELPVRYSVPSPNGDELPATLMYKWIGRHYSPTLPTESEVGAAVREIREVVYGFHSGKRFFEAAEESVPDR